jgi:GT2 family glycosyltransferase
MMRAVSERPGHRMVASLQFNLHDPSKLDGAGDNYLAYGYAWRGGFGHAASSAPPAGECFGPCGAAALYPRDLFLEAGGFDERYFCYHEDVDIAFRLRLLGEKCQFAPDARIRHAGSAVTGRTSRFSVFHGVRNGVWTYVKNMPGGWLLLTSAGLACRRHPAADPRRVPGRLPRHLGWLRRGFQRHWSHAANAPRTPRPATHQAGSDGRGLHLEPVRLSWPPDRRPAFSA